MKRSPYPAGSYRRLFDASAGPLWDKQTGLDPSEDGDHYQAVRDFFEWWYFDAAFHNGYRLVTILHSSLYNAVDHKPTIDIRITRPPMDGHVPSITAIGRYSRKEYRAAADHCDVQIAGCQAKNIGPGEYHLLLDQGTVSADLHYHALAPGWKPGNGYLFADPASGHFFKWVVPLPAARVTGRLSIDGDALDVEGMGYHDHNWGNFVLADAFQSWYWGRVFAMRDGRPWAAVFGDVRGWGDGAERVRPFMLVAGGEILTGEPTLKLAASDIQVEPRTRVMYPRCVELTAASDGYQVNLSLQTEQVMEALDFANSPFRLRWLRQLSEIAFYVALDKPLIGKLIRRLLGKASYLRLGASSQLRFRRSGEAPPDQLGGEAVFELMQFE